MNCIQRSQRRPERRSAPAEPRRPPSTRLSVSRTHRPGIPPAPAIGVGFTEESLCEVDVPVCIVVGDADQVAPAATHAQRYAKHIPNARLFVLPRRAGVLPGIDLLRSTTDGTPQGRNIGARSFSSDCSRGDRLRPRVADRIARAERCRQFSRFRDSGVPRASTTRSSVSASPT
jgi:hypothetical protein